MVEGYSQIKKVTDEGRAQMSLDTKTLHAALRKLLPDMAPSVGYVEDYIRAFYLPPEDLIAWARSHPQYLMRHRMAMMTLNGVYAGLKKKEQQEVLEALTQLVE
uniref:Syndetin C-terminal domain-containing protein n=1 Tax=Strombidinopsis acuminata TaxID=141414 RepID=A0A7S3T4Y2_9SPIT